MRGLSGSVSPCFPCAWSHQGTGVTQVPGQPNKVVWQRASIRILRRSFQEGFVTKAEPDRRRKGLTAEGIPNPLK